MGMADFAQDLKLQASRKCKSVFSWVSQVPNFTVSSMRCVVPTQHKMRTVGCIIKSRDSKEHILIFFFSSD